MTTQDSFRAELMRSRALMKRGKTMFFSGLLFPLIPALFVSLNLVAKDSLPTIAGILASILGAGCWPFHHGSRSREIEVSD